MLLPCLTRKLSLWRICGEYFKHSTDKDLFNYFKAHYQHWFPNLSDRTLFVRQAANLWQFKALIEQQIVCQAEQAFADLQVIDTLPVSVCQWVRRIGDKCLAAQADDGYCAAKEQHYYGFKLGLRCSRRGMITFASLLPARPHDVNFSEELALGGGARHILGDKGFLDSFRHQLLADRYGTRLIVRLRKNMTEQNQETFDKTTAKLFGKVRKVIETVGSHLTERFNLNKIRVRDLWHFQSRLIRKILAHTVAVFLNLQLKRKPLDLDGLVLN
ncbi:MAG: IS982 family transposase [Acidobacteriota bacterium]|nr:IS982 family transposase [Acidobacteriota bacterium]